MASGGSPDRMPDSEPVWLKVALAPTTITFSYSLDGKAWHPLRSVPRRKDYAGPPAELILGRAMGGPNDHLDNDAKWSTGVTRTALGELAVGRD